jgi:2-C-methyl-D-erythritol 4-phosphate cytidylyltransferase
MSASETAKPLMNQGNLAAQQPRIWAVIPAAGVGTRMANATLPKQFLKIGDQTILERSVRALLADPRVQGVCVVVSVQDTLSQPALETLLAESDRVNLAYCGGASRATSVANGLADCLIDKAQVNDWVLVHDGARPGLSASALSRLIDRVLAQAPSRPDIGGLLALAVVDTVKRGQQEWVQTTLSRDGLWLAQTPQMFRFGLLQNALTQFADVTDEASAMEAAGHPVLLVEGERENFKITIPDDLQWAERLLLK